MEELRNQITGLKESIRSARESERLFIKAQTLTEQTDKARLAMGKMEIELEALKEKKTALKAERAGMLKESCDPMAEAITALLPRGKAIITLDGDLFIGWEHDGRLSPYPGLSGGEKVFFDGALSNALLRGPGDKIILLEAAELDRDNLAGTLAAIAAAHPEAQVIVNSCHVPREVPSGWQIVRL